MTEIVRSRTWVPLFPDQTNLPMTVWVGLQKAADEQPMILCCRRYGVITTTDDVAVIGLYPTKTLLRGILDAVDIDRLFLWIEWNHRAIDDYWNCRIDPFGMMQALRKIAPP